MKKLFLLIVLFVFVSGYTLMAQTKVITGTVTSAVAGEGPIPGVTVVAKGTTVGAITDVNGKYTITVPTNVTTLVFSYIGMKSQEVEIAGRIVIDGVLQSELLALNEVVVTALGISRGKKALGYSVQDVNGDNISSSKQPDLINALSGKVAGVQVVNSTGTVGGSSYITIRGVNSITGETQPLFVVDGVPIDNSMNYSGNPDNGQNNLVTGTAYANRASDLNPDDIESVSVLKGGAATALYGLQASNGVVMITTKKGNSSKENSFNVNFSSSVEIDQVSQLPKIQNMFAQGSNGKWQGPDASGGNGTNKSWGPKLDTMRYDGSNYAWDINGKLVGQSKNPTGKVVTPYDNLGNFFQNGVSYNNNISFSGGNDKSNYFMSYSNLNSTGVVPLNTFVKNTVKISGESKLTKNLKVGGSVMYINDGGNSAQQGSNLSGVMLSLLRAPNTFDFTNGYSDAASHPLAYEFADGTQRNYISAYDNPFWSVNNNKTKTNVDRIIGNYNLNFAPLDWLVFNYRFGNDVYFDRRFSYFAINSQGGSDAPLGSLFNDSHFSSILNSDLTADIKKNLTNDIKADLLVGQNMYQNYGQQTYMEGDGISIPNFYQISNTSSQVTRENESKKRTAALYADLNLSYKSLLFLDFTGRNEWSTTLPENNNSFFFPSVSGSFNFSELDAFKGSILTFGKLRASYASTANDAPLFLTRSYYTLSTFNDGWTNGISFPFANTIGSGVNSFELNGILANPKLRPEFTNNFEVGVDLNFLSRISLNFTYFDNVNKDQIIGVPVAGSSGYVVNYTNIGKMENKGVEITANFTPVKTKDFTWNFTLNFTKINNKVIALAPNVDYIGLNGFTGITVEAVAGKPYGQIFASSFLKDAQGRTVIDDVPGDPTYGQPIRNDNQTALGSYLPNWTGSWSNSLTYKGVSLTFLLDVRNGGLMWNGTLSRLIGFGTSAETENRGTTTIYPGVEGHLDADGKLVSTGTANSIPMTLNQTWYSTTGGGANPIQSQFVEKTDWTRLREVTLSYAFSSKLLSNIKFKSLSVFATGKNLFLKTPYKGVDPETSLTGATSSQGLDYFNMPGIKGYIFGLKVGF